VHAEPSNGRLSNAPRIRRRWPTRPGFEPRPLATGCEQTAPPGASADARAYLAAVNAVYPGWETVTRSLQQEGGRVSLGDLAAEGQYSDHDDTVLRRAVRSIGLAISVPEPAICARDGRVDSDPSCEQCSACRAVVRAPWLCEGVGTSLRAVASRVCRSHVVARLDCSSPSTGTMLDLTRSSTSACPMLTRWRASSGR
jgi:hypothetical protein